VNAALLLIYHRGQCHDAPPTGGNDIERREEAIFVRRTQQNSAVQPSVGRIRIPPHPFLSATDSINSNGRRRIFINFGGVLD